MQPNSKGFNLYTREQSFAAGIDYTGGRSRIFVPNKNKNIKIGNTDVGLNQGRSHKECCCFH
jgi:hypothetical protein